MIQNMEDSIYTTRKTLKWSIKKLSEALPQNQEKILIGQTLILGVCHINLLFILEHLEEVDIIHIAKKMN